MKTLEIDSVRKSFTNGNGETVEVLDGISFEVGPGSFTSIMGPSGCGKTTLLNVIAGILEYDSGAIKVDAVPYRQEEIFCPYVFQEPRLLEWKTVESNIKIVLDAQDIPRDAQDAIVQEYLDKVGLSGEGDKYPQQLSGGMQQRVGVARALAAPSDFMLMDEPFSSLDELTAEKLRSDLVDLWQETNKTILFITHDMREAITLSERILFMSPDEGLFHDAEIGLPYPRDIEDKAVMEREAELMGMMSDHTDVI